VLAFLSQRNIHYKIVFFGTSSRQEFAQEIIDLICKKATKKTEKCLQEFIYIKPEGAKANKPLNYYKELD
jgi:hypothetical protein